MRNTSLSNTVATYSFSLSRAFLFVALCPVVIVQSNFASAGMVAYWPWDNSVVDSTGQVSPDGILEPGASPAGFSSTAIGGTHSLDLSPANSRFRVPFQSAVQIGNGTDFTLSFWIRPDSSGTNAHSRIFDTRGTGSGGDAAGLQIKINETHASGWAFSNVFLDNGSTGTELISTGTGYSDNSWHHVAVTYNSVAEQIRFFVGGTADTALLSTAAIGNFDGGKDLALGAEIYSVNSFIAEATARTQKYTGLMDEFAIFDEVLSDAQIAALAAGTLLPSEFLPPVPEPSSALLLGMGILFMAKRVRRRQR